MDKNWRAIDWPAKATSASTENTTATTRDTAELVRIAIPSQPCAGLAHSQRVSDSCSNRPALGRERGLAKGGLPALRLAADRRHRWPTPSARVSSFLGLTAG